MKTRSLTRAAWFAMAWLCGSACSSGASTPRTQPQPAGTQAGDGSSGAGAESGGSAGVAGVASSGGAGGTSAGDTSSAGSSAGMSAAGASGDGDGDGDGDARDGGASDDDFTSGLTPPDPNVTFEWTATTPGDSDCLPGRYTGTFTCDYFNTPMDTMPLVVVSGPVAITLEQSQDGEFLVISDGKLEGVAQLIIGFRAELAGQLDCATHELQAQALNGAYGFGDPAVLPFGTFEGTLGGVLDGTTSTLAGEWNLMLPTGGFCRGPWQANWAP